MIKSIGKGKRSLDLYRSLSWDFTKYMIMMQTSEKISSG